VGVVFARLESMRGVKHVKSIQPLSLTTVVRRDTRCEQMNVMLQSPSADALLAITRCNDHARAIVGCTGAPALHVPLPTPDIRHLRVIAISRRPSSISSIINPRYTAGWYHSSCSGR
jgi:hypothetical protein